MHIDHDNLVLQTESDVEQKVVMPLLTGNMYLAIGERRIFTKKYLAPTDLDKKAGRTTGYYPDYTAWMGGFPVLVVEAKAPDVQAETGYREAALYAGHLNRAYPTNINPCRFVIATNGNKLLFGYWDSMPVIEIDVSDILPGSTHLDALKQNCGVAVLESHAADCLRRVRKGDLIYPYDLAGGSALLNAKLAVNAFAADLSPILKRYFTSSSQEDSREIIERAYVNSAEVTEYDRILEALLKERLSVQRGTIVQQLEPGRYAEEHVERVISDFNRDRPQGGQLQIIQGAVGSGKSLFTRRYKEVLQSNKLAEVTRWAFVDFNSSPADLAHSEKWLCSIFAESFQRENLGLDLTSSEVLRGVFSRNIQKRRGVYELLEATSPERAAIAKADDLKMWQDDPEETARGIANYVLGVRQEVLIAVLDNVDRLDLKNQLDAFQLALWFMQRTKCFVILQMRDETFERYKNRPPLDTFRTGIIFHISSPRFVDVVKRRLELSLEYLAANAKEQQTYAIETGLRFTYPRSRLENFLQHLYSNIFDRKRNISRVLQSLAGRDVRRALDMFVSIITSGHLSETSITSTVIGGGTIPINEHDILKILMRTEYRFFSDRSGFVSNILAASPKWEKPDNFLLAEILYFLAVNRKKVGQIGLEGYFTCRHVAEELQRLGYVPDDVLDALNVLLARELIAADHMNFVSVGPDDSVRILASGWMHVRILAGRLEYLYGIIPTIPIFDKAVARQLAEFVTMENSRGGINPHQKVRAVEILYTYLLRQKQTDFTPFSVSNDTGSAYILKHIAGAIGHFHRSSAGARSDPDELDF
ncbi:MAG: type I restriction enzyme HsdR N-terminal domain-containing protein [Terriglobales bacterium]